MMFKCRRMAPDTANSLATMLCIHRQLVVVVMAGEGVQMAFCTWQHRVDTCTCYACRVLAIPLRVLTCPREVPSVNKP